MFFKGIAIFFIIYRSIEVELIKSKRATHFDFWVTLSKGFVRPSVVWMTKGRKDDSL